ncbi:MAG: hypothetical protein K2Q22_05925 [Cytophagales bacterium]|nr:hypothetical protein [Cytophagales bacterium]
MKKLISIGFALIFLFQGGVRLFIIADYNIRKEKIAATICVNRNNPALGCEGHCYLERQLKNQQEKEGKIPNFLKEKGEMDFLINSIQINVLCFQSAENSWTSVYQRNCLDAFSSIFHPPPDSIG